MKFLIGEVKVLDDDDLLCDVHDYLFDNVYEEVATNFNSYLDTNNTTEIAGLRLSPSEVLFKVAPEEYDIKLDDWLNNIIIKICILMSMTI